MVSAAGERSARRLWPALPYTLRLDHPPTAELRPRYGYGRPAHQRLEALMAASTDRYRDHLESFGTYFDELARIPVEGQQSSEPCWVHPWLIGMDTVSLYSFTRLRRPARYVEVGSGQSTKVIARARRDGALPLEITSIDPQPRSEVDSLCDRLVRMPLEKADLGECFAELGAGDIVFFDGSHRVLPNSDCVAFFLDVLPSLPPGVLVGVHDIWLPDDYPDGFIEYWWSEQYLLAALMIAEPSWLRIELPLYYASGLPELAALAAPLFERPGLNAVNPRGSLCWLQTGTR
jgi:predicted O-methyltransferase YrrM